MAQNPSPIPLICVARLRERAIGQEQDLAPHFTYPGIVDFDNYSPRGSQRLA
jgi:hypothetical protein